MNRTKTNEENEWRASSHPRLVKRLDDQRAALSDLNYQVERLISELASTKEQWAADCGAAKALRDTLTAERDQLQTEVNKWRDACCANCLHSPCMCLVHDLEVERDTLAAKVAELQAVVDKIQAEGGQQ